MEPVDLPKTEGSGGFAKRRLSSILKASRKSIRVDLEQQENVVECPKPGEKTTSRRVSFAPTNDVLLFSKDVKNDSSARSPFQELMTSTADAQNRGKFAACDEGVQQITGMETLLNAPLHAREQRDTAHDFGEKTVMFSADDDAFMDMTRSHTINIANDADISLHNYDLSPPAGESAARGAASSPSSRNADSRPEIKNKSSSVPSLDADFQVFLASLSKPSGQSASRTAPPAGASPLEANILLSQIKTPQQHTDKENLAPALVMETSRRSLGAAVNPEDDESMDMTEAQTGRIEAFRDTDDHDAFRCLFPSQEMYAQKEETTKLQQSRKSLPACYSTGAGNSVKSSLKTKVQRHQVNFEAEDDGREKTLRFSADDACMDLTRSLTVNIARELQTQPPQRSDFLPACGEKTLRFSADDACMDLTRSLTVNIARELQTQPPQRSDFLPACGEKTLRFSADDACMDMTQSHTVNIAAELELQSLQDSHDLPACGDKTVRFTEDAAAMDMTHSLTVDISRHAAPDALLPLKRGKSRTSSAGLRTGFYQVHPAPPAAVPPAAAPPAAAPPAAAPPAPPAAPSSNIRETFSRVSVVQVEATKGGMDVKRSHSVNTTDFLPDADRLPSRGTRTLGFTAAGAAMDVTRGHAENIFSENVDVVPAGGAKTICFSEDDAAMEETKSYTVNIWGNLGSSSASTNKSVNVSSEQENNDAHVFTKQRERESCHLRRTRSASAQMLDKGFKNSFPESSDLLVNPGITNSPQEVLHPLGLKEQIKSAKPLVDPQPEALCFVSAATEKTANETIIQDDMSMDMTEAQTGHIVGQALSSSTHDESPNNGDFSETDVKKEAPGASNRSGDHIPNPPDSLDSRRSSPGSSDADSDAAPAQMSRRRSLASLISKVRRLSHLINTTPDSLETQICSAQATDINQEEKAQSAPAMAQEPGACLEKNEENPQTEAEVEDAEVPLTTTPFKLQTQQLMSRLSVGGFQAKLPQRTKPTPQKKEEQTGEPAVTVNANNQPTNFDGDASDINDEELGSYEDMSETIDTGTLQNTEREVAPFTEEPLEDDVFEDLIRAKKRHPSPDEDEAEENKRRRDTAQDVDVGFAAHAGAAVESDAHLTSARSTDNSSHTASTRCEATLESTFNQSLFESQDDGSDMRRRFSDGSITMLEFFKLFNIDFVIHNPRQSVLPGRVSSDVDRTPMDLLRARHIFYPTQVVYEASVQELTEKVERMKFRMKDLRKPLRVVNRTLWEDLRNSSEAELKGFGAKLREWHNWFRKCSEVQSHEMKEVLYSQLIQAHQDDQQKLRGRVEEADEMIRSLDECIQELETEMAVVEEGGSDGTPGMTSLQEELERVSAALTEGQRQTCELEIQKTRRLTQLNQVKAEVKHLQMRADLLNLIHEWRLGERGENHVTFTFLHNTLHLQLLYEPSTGTDSGNDSGRKISHIEFKFDLDAEQSKDHACLVHALVSRHIHAKTEWLEEYPTRSHVPELLHDVGLVVSRCRLLGEELRQLRRWRNPSLDIVHLSCTHTQIRIVFSSLEMFKKFQLIFCVSLENLRYVLKLASFENVIGDTRVEQVEDIVASFAPSKNLLTKIMRKIHGDLLS